MTPSIETNSVTTIFPMVTSVCRGMRSSGQELRELVEHGRPAVVGLRAARLADHVARHLGPPAEISERACRAQIDVAVTPDQPLGLDDLEERPPDGIPFRSSSATT